MDDDGEQGGLFLSCNMCQRPLTTMYKTACNHCYCPACADAHFSQDPHCAIDGCNMKLTQKHFTGPIDVGVMATETIESALYKNVLSSGLLQDIILNALNAIPALENVLALVSSQTYLEVGRATRRAIEAEGKYKQQRRNIKTREQDYRNKLAALDSQLKTAESYKRKLNDQVTTLQMQLDDLARKNKSMEQVLVKLRAEGHNVPSIPALPTPVSTPPPQHHNPPPMALPSPRHGPAPSSSSTGYGQGRHLQQQQQQQQYYQQMPPPALRARSPSPMTGRPSSYAALPPGTPSSTTSGYSHHQRRSSSAGAQGIPGFGGAGSMASRLSPRRSAVVSSSTTSALGPYHGGGGGGYPQQQRQQHQHQQRSPKPQGFGLEMRY